MIIMKGRGNLGVDTLPLGDEKLLTPLFILAKGGEKKKEVFNDKGS
jgi:hypothetical protein